VYERINCVIIVCDQVIQLRNINLENVGNVMRDTTLHCTDICPMVQTTVNDNPPEEKEEEDPGNHLQVAYLRTRI
jgi:hypothetical protein